MIISFCANKRMFDKLPKLCQPIQQSLKIRVIVAVKFLVLILGNWVNEKAH